MKKFYRTMAKSSLSTPNIRKFFLKSAGVQVGKDVVINEGFTLISDIGWEKNLTIEDRVAFGPNVSIILTSHPNNSLLKDYKQKFPFIEIYGNLVIKHDAWIGAGSILLPNIEIGEFSVVGAGSVVTRDVSPFTVVAGVPAKLIRSIQFEEDA